MNATMNPITKWIHPEWDQALIVTGTPEATRNQAEQYIGMGSPEQLTYEHGEMTIVELNALPEFDG